LVISWIGLKFIKLIITRTKIGELARNKIEQKKRKRPSLKYHLPLKY